MTDRALIFDMDGVIIDSVPLHYRSYATILKKYGLPNYSREEFDQTMGYRSVDIFRLKKDKYHLDLVPETAAKEKEAFLSDLFDRELKLCDGTIQLLDLARNNDFKIALGTTGNRKVVDYVLKRFDLRTYFDVVLSADDIKYGKPDPEVFLVGSQKLGVEPKNCLVLEDAPLGIDAAHNANMRCIAVTTSYERSKLTKADLIVDSLSEIGLETLVKLLRD